ncbi:MAG: hypothetical protein V1837_00265 [Candidatus Woesearchaeota archaeon]
MQTDGKWTTYTSGISNEDINWISNQKQLVKESTKEFNLRMLNIEREKIKADREREFREKMKEERKLREKQRSCKHHD